MGVAVGLRFADCCQHAPVSAENDPRARFRGLEAELFCRHPNGALWRRWGAGGGLTRPAAPWSVAASMAVNRQEVSINTGMTFGEAVVAGEGDLIQYTNPVLVCVFWMGQ